jgi:hypothetical protein
MAPMINAPIKRLEDYLGSLKAAIYRPGLAEDEHGTVEHQVVEVHRHTQECSSFPWWNELADSGEILHVYFVTESCHAGGSSWREQRLHMVYTDFDKLIHRVQVLDFDDVIKMAWGGKGISSDDLDYLQNRVRIQNVLEQSLTELGQMWPADRAWNWAPDRAIGRHIGDDWLMDFRDDCSDAIGDISREHRAKFLKCACDVTRLAIDLANCINPTD